MHFDYIRFQDDFYGYNQIGKNIFYNKYGFNYSDIERGIISTEYGWKSSEIESMKETWNKYKRDNINSLISQTRQEIKISDKKIALSAAVKPNPKISKKKWSQDWKTWINKELLDFVVVMNYHEDKTNFNLNIESIKKEIKKIDKIIMGISIWNQESSDVKVKINKSKENKFKGISLFSYESQKDNGFYFMDIKNAFDKIDEKNNKYE